MKNEFKLKEIIYHIINETIYLIEDIEIIDGVKIYYLNNFENSKTCSGFECLLSYEDCIKYKGSIGFNKWKSFEEKNGFVTTEIKSKLRFLLSH